MTDINDIQQDLQSIEEIINGPSGLIQSKAAIKRALEAKLNVSIPDENPLKIYDDYIYMIPSAEGNSRTLVLGESTSDNYQMYPIDFKDSDWFYINPNGETSISDSNLIFEGDTTKRYSSIGNVAIKKPELLTGSNIINGVTIFGIEGCGGEPDGINPGGINTTVDDIPTTKVGLCLNGEGYNKISGNVQDVRTGSSFNWNTTNINLTENNSFIFNLPTKAELDSNPDNLRVKENVIIDSNFGLETNFSDIVNAINESNNELDSNKILPENIKYGCTLLGVDGTFTNDANITNSGNPREGYFSNNIIEGYSAYSKGKKIQGRIKKRNFEDDCTIETNENEPITYVKLKAGSYWPSYSYVDVNENTVYTKEIGSLIYTLNIKENSTPSGSRKDPQYYIAGPRILTLTPSLNVTAAGYLGVGEYEDESPPLEISIIDTEAFYNSENGGIGYPYNEYGDKFKPIAPNSLLEGYLGVDGEGNILKGSLKNFNDSRSREEDPPTWNWCSYSASGINVSPTQRESWGYYGPNSQAYIENNVIVNAVNKFAGADPRLQLKEDNIKTGVTIFGIPGSYSGDIEQDSLILTSLNLKFSDEITKRLTYTPDLGKLYNEVIVVRDDDLYSENIAYGSKIYGVTGTFTQEIKKPATDSDLLMGKVAYVNGEKLTGNINIRNISADLDQGLIYKKDKKYSLRGYWPAGEIEIAPTEKDKIIPKNIRTGVEILGVIGEYSGGSTFETIKDSSLDSEVPEYNKPLLKINSLGTSFFFTGNKESKNRFCWHTVDYNTPLDVANTDSYIIPDDAKICFNVIPDVEDVNVLPILVRIYSVEKNLESDNIIREEKEDITIKNNKVKYKYLYSYVVDNVKKYGYYLIDGTGDGSSIVTPTKTLPEGAIIEGALLDPVSSYNLKNSYNYGSYEYIREVGSQGSAVFKYDELVIPSNNEDEGSTTYKRYTLEVSGHQAVKADVSYTTAEPNTVVKDKWFVTKQGISKQGLLEGISKINPVLDHEVIYGDDDDCRLSTVISYGGSDYKDGEFTYYNVGDNTSDDYKAIIKITRIGWPVPPESISSFKYIVKYKDEVDPIKSGDFNSAYINGENIFVPINFNVGHFEVTQELQTDEYHGLTYIIYISSKKSLIAEENGRYENEAGYSNVTVRVPQYNINGGLLLSSAPDSESEFIMKVKLDNGEIDYNKQGDEIGVRRGESVRFYSYPVRGSSTIDAYLYIDDIETAIADLKECGASGYSWKPDSDFTVKFSNVNVSGGYNIYVERQVPEATQDDVTGIISIN